MAGLIYHRIENLPRRIPVFPLTGAILLPNCQLPLNIFEPRYLNMIDDAMSGSRVIGMVQASPQTSAPAQPALAKIGCLGRLTSYSETDDGRYLINLFGVCRFRIKRELSAQTPYRLVEADYSLFRHDIEPRPQADTEDHVSHYGLDRDSILGSLRYFLDTHQLQLDWQEVESISAHELVDVLTQMCPFDAYAKQKLLEAPDHASRGQLLRVLLEFGTHMDGNSTLQ